ncbi:uncharacterized protein LOC129808503 [Phlebotomus papatasi]|uniref:uncharacterized protein LOC129808503 n=1 Tax=Phlebotomus papatasi TaxID=29031 RepID=UPI00248434DC|nr:uncharacterized protein LOC129808503 [Phlebotomus papatasi]
MPNESGQQGDAPQEQVQSQPQVAGKKKVSLRPPPPLVLDGTNNKAAWEDWDNLFEWYAEAVQLHEEPPKVQVAVFMSAIGSAVKDIFKNFELSDSEKYNLKIVRERFTQHFAPTGNEIYESYKFNNLMQDVGETVGDFITRVKTQASRCNFPVSSKSRLIRDRIIHGIKSSQTREEILKKNKLTLDETIVICQVSEKAAEHTIAMTAGSSEKVEVNTVKKESEVKKKSESSAFCGKCGLKHAYRACPAYKKKCKKCGLIGHFATMCKKSVEASNKTTTKRKVKKVEKDSDSDSESEVSVDTLRIHSINKDDGDAWNCVMKVNHKKIIVNIDTGAQCNVLSRKVLSKLPQKDIEPSRVKKLVAYDGGKIKVIGRVQLDCFFRKKKIPLWFQIVEGDRACVLDGKSAIKAGLIARVNSINVKEEIFSGLGCLKDFVYDAEIIDDPKFVIHPARTVPYKIEKEVKAEIDDMLKTGVVKPCTHG